MWGIAHDEPVWCITAKKLLARHGALLRGLIRHPLPIVSAGRRTMVLPTATL